MTAPRVLAVGARGFVGAHLVRRFLDAGYEVQVLGPPMERDLLADLAGRFVDIEASVEDEAAVDAAVRSARPDLVVSLAAYSAGDQGLTRSGEADAEAALSVNVLGFRRLLEAARRAGVPRVLWSSSTVVFGPAGDYPDGPLDETAERRPRTVYGLTKVLAEQVAEFYRDRHDLEVCAVRLPLVFGPGLWYRGAAAPLSGLFEAAAPGEVQHVAATAERFDAMYVKDVAEAFLALATHPGRLSATYHINGFAITYPELAEAVCARVPGYRVEFEPAPAPITYPLVTAGRIAREIGFRPVHDLDAAVADHLSHRGGTHR